MSKTTAANEPGSWIEGRTRLDKWLLRGGDVAGPRKSSILSAVDVAGRRPTVRRVRSRRVPDVTPGAGTLPPGRPLDLRSMERRIGHEPFSDATLVWDGEPMRGAGTRPTPTRSATSEIEPFEPGRITMRFREGNQALVGMPWDQPLAHWSGPELEFVDLPVGASRHTVRFAMVDGSIIALKELPLDIGQREYDVLRELEARGAPVGQGLRPGHPHRRLSSIILTRYLARSFQFRRLFMRLPEGERRYRDQLLDSMTGLLVELHRMGMFWGDCSLANTLLMRDGQRLQAYLVDGETSEIHEQLSDGQREADIEIAIENVAGDLADMAVMNGKSMEEIDDDFEAALSLRDRYDNLWDVLHQDVAIHPDKRYRVDKRLHDIHELGYVVDEIILEPGDDGSGGPAPAGRGGRTRLPLAAIAPAHRTSRRARASRPSCSTTSPPGRAWAGPATGKPRRAPAAAS